MRILLLGDSHHDPTHINFAYEQAARFDCEVVFVLGDFGWWPNTRYGIDFIKFCGLISRRTGIPLVFLDGNHEHHLSLNRFVEEDGRDGFIKLDSHLMYSPRGHHWEWDGIKFMTLGGAFSIDRSARSLGFSYFEEEVIDDADVERCMSAGKVDVLLTHDAPTEVDLAAEFATVGRKLLKERISGTEANRERLQRVVDRCNPDYIFHGHWHIDYRQRLENGRLVSGLDCNGRPRESFSILDTDELELRR